MYCVCTLCKSVNTNKFEFVAIHMLCLCVTAVWETEGTIRLLRLMHDRCVGKVLKVKQAGEKHRRITRKAKSKHIQKKL